jgi:hypothetical protein
MVMEVQDVKIMSGYKQTDIGVIPEDWDLVGHLTIGL